VTIDVERLMAQPIPSGRQLVTAKDAILYAISVGYAGQSEIPDDLSPLYDRIVRPVPTFANVVARPGGAWFGDSGIDFTKVVHAEHRLILHREMPLGEMLEGRVRMVSVVDRGVGIRSRLQPSSTPTPAGPTVDADRRACRRNR
jgi:MFE-2 hydratase 2 N-terminal domain